MFRELGEEVQPEVELNEDEQEWVITLLLEF